MLYQSWFDIINNFQLITPRASTYVIILTRRWEFDKTTEILIIIITAIMMTIIIIPIQVRCRIRKCTITYIVLLLILFSKLVIYYLYGRENANGGIGIFCYNFIGRVKIYRVSRRTYYCYLLLSNISLYYVIRTHTFTDVCFITIIRKLANHYVVLLLWFYNGPVDFRNN